MGTIADEIKSYIGCSTYSEDDILHIGVKRRSGRYPWGSGQDPFQHSRDFLGRVDELKKQGFTYTDENGKTWTGDNAIAKHLGITTTEYRQQISWANYERRLLQVETAKALAKDGLGPTKIGEKMGLNESTVRSLLDPAREDRMKKPMETVNLLRSEVDKKKMLDVNSDMALELNISKEQLNLALDYLERIEGYPVYKGGIPQATNVGQQTNQRVLCVPGTEHKEIYQYDKIGTIHEYASHDGGETFDKFVYPKSMDSKRLMIRYADDKGPDGVTGIEKDGIIELRRGVKDLSLGDARYSQVRILVDDDRYLKGMAVYSDDLPDGVDVVFNTNKGKDVPMRDVLKKIGNDPDNPFGSLIKPKGQMYYEDENGNKQLGLINKRADEGDWDEWANAIPSQFLSKQPLALAKKQLNLDKKDRLDEFSDICALENPTIKKHLLRKFADSCDAAAVNLKAAALPGQRYHVIIPVNKLKDTEVYAPNYENGTKLALIRYPHGGLFEIPILTVNNRNITARKLLGTDIVDAVGINSKIAEQLSGADFDGDTVMCIPTHDSSGKVKIAHKDYLDELKVFDPKMYKYDEMIKDAKGVEHYYRNGHEFKVMKNKGKEMGVISNLITDMTLGGASDDKLARAVKHSMVVIDAEKHKLDYKASEIENDIASLKREYQFKLDKNGNERPGGASTLISKAKGDYRTDKRQGSYTINIKGSKNYDPTRPEGAKLWKVADDLYYVKKERNKKTGLTTIRTEDGNKVVYDPKDKVSFEKYNPVKKIDPDTGEVIFTNKAGDITYHKSKHPYTSTNMAETDDAYSLVSQARHPMELVYADYANDMKDLGNRARIELTNTGKVAYSKQAKQEYQTEVTELMEKLRKARLNAPRERAANRLAAAEIKEKQLADPDMKPGDLKKARQQAITKYRNELGSISRRERNIDITDREWEAIQKGAITESKLEEILNNTDIDKLRERATPHATNTLSSAKVSRIKAMAASNYTLEEISKKLGISTTAVSKYLKGGK